MATTLLVVMLFCLMGGQEEQGGYEMGGTKEIFKVSIFFKCWIGLDWVGLTSSSLKLRFMSCFYNTDTLCFD